MSWDKSTRPPSISFCVGKFLHQSLSSSKFWKCLLSISSCVNKLSVFHQSWSNHAFYTILKEQLFPRATNMLLALFSHPLTWRINLHLGYFLCAYLYFLIDFAENNKRSLSPTFRCHGGTAKKQKKNVPTSRGGGAPGSYIAPYVAKFK